MINVEASVDGFDISIPEVPITEERKPFYQKEGYEKLNQAGTARANEAASYEAPRGTVKGDYAYRHRHQTVLQQHITFFDHDSDGVIWPLDTFHGFRSLGYSLVFSLLSMFLIHFNFSYPTVSGFLPDPFFRIYVARIHRDKHGSDSGSFDPEGRFEPQQFEDIFAKYASGDKQGITLVEIVRFINGRRVVMDIFGLLAAIFEWLATYILLWPEDGRMKKEDIRGVYDGSLFYDISARRRKIE